MRPALSMIARLCSSRHLSLSKPTLLATALLSGHCAADPEWGGPIEDSGDLVRFASAGRDSDGAVVTPAGRAAIATVCASAPAGWSRAPYSSGSQVFFFLRFLSAAVTISLPPVKNSDRERVLS